MLFRSNNTTGIDDEDGVWWPCNFTPGHRNTVQITTTGQGFLNAWIDYNIDGDWSDAGEQVFVNTPLPAGVTDLSILVPVNASTGTTFARFRFSSQQNLSFTGYAPDGEVEDYMIVIQAAVNMEYGDAPDPSYPTLAASNGARHVNDTYVPIFLGNKVDWEIDGLTSANANGDDNNNLADEDGVTLNTPLVPGQVAFLTVTASIGGGSFQAWIDFNHNGTWSDAGEQVFTNTPLVAGAQLLRFNVPVGATTGKTCARFRYSTMGNLKPYGCAPNGEVEDYMVTINDASSILSVKELYDNPAVKEGDTVYAAGYYTNPGYYFMLNFYGDWNMDRPMPAQSYLVLTGTLPPDSAQNGGYLLVRGIVHYVSNPNPYHPEDSLIIHLNALQVHVYYAGAGSSGKSGYPVKGQNVEYEIKSPLACDSCKFAVLISGGVDEANNHSKYWENLVALYKYKVENEGYCPANVHVHYYDGVGRDGRIPAWNVAPADSVSIHNSFNSVAQSVANCTSKGKPATFQKMITNHGEADGDICLLGDKVLKPGEVKDMEQSIINACCTKMYDELLECYAGYTVDVLSTLNILNKATVYVNSNSDKNCGYSPHDSVHPYLQTKINMLKAGNSYPQAVDSARKAYQKYLQRLLDYAHWAANWYRNHPTYPKSDSLRDQWVKDSTELANALKSTRNVIRTPMNKFCEWKEFVIPPGGQLVLDFEGNSNNCGNVAINIVDPVTGVIKEMVLNWNISGSAGYAPGNNKRVINGDPNKSTTVRVHDDNNGPGYTLTGSCNAVQSLTQSVSNESSFPGFSFGGSDDSREEFAVLHEPTIFLPDIDHIPLNLNMLPAYMGSGFVQNFGGSFTINTSDPYWTNMQLQIDVAEVLTPGTLVITSPNTEMETYVLSISTPGIYTVLLGDMTLHGEMGHLYFNTGGKSNAPSSLAFSFDSWALRTLYGSSSSNLDFGDAPDPAYPTLLASNGARHAFDNVTYLGTRVDAETDGFPGATATGDDLNGTDDEDGVTFMWPISPGNPCKIKVNASVGTALLNAWIDFNGNGSWADAGEQIYTDLNLYAGDNYLTFIAPATSVLGQTYARFRFSHQAALSFTGIASDGEVEDYIVSITDLGQIKWQQPPDATLPGTHAHNDIRVADDWLCKGGQITDIGWWGNYELDPAGLEKRGTGISHFVVSIHTDNAATCLPVNPPVASFIVQFNSITETNTGLINNEGCPIYYYTFNLPQPFIQTVGNRYWISIMANPNNPLTPAIWRWQEANRWYIPVLCGAASETSVIPWQTILIGTPSKSLDMAFELKSQAASISIDPDPADQFVQNEISMALVPGNTPGVPATLIAAYNDHPYGGGPGLGVSYSNDGGATWTPLQFTYPLDPLGIPYLDAFDPAATADGSGNVYVAHISTDFDWVNGPESGLYICKSTNGGVNWASPVQISYDGKPTASPDPNYRFNDRCQIIADIHTASPYYNYLYAVWIKDRGWNMAVPMSDIYFSSSSDGGATWSPAVIINENQHNMANMPIPAVASDGRIYVSWMDYNVTTGGSGKIYFNTSTDGGATWLPTDTYIMPVLLPPLRLNSGSDVLAKGAAVIDVSPTNPLNLYLVYAQASLNMIDEGTILFRKSTDGGATWSTPLKVNDDVTTADQVLPWMDVKPNGTIDIAWYDRRNDPTDLKWDVYFASSTDEGNTFSVNTKVSATAAPSPNTPSGLWMGEYLGLVTDTTHAYICYTSSATDVNGDIFFNKLANPAIETDYGDAPDPTYPTLLASNGARHINTGLKLGARLDTEPNGQQNATATGDDNIPPGLNDEDGVWWPFNFVPGHGNTIRITATAAGYLNAWMDFNRNGSWAEAGEQIFTNIPVAAGINDLSMLVPTNASLGNTFARFRFSTQQNLSYTGLATDGEVEDYQVTIQVAEDMEYGDAPDSYKTLAVSNGARHDNIGPNVFMGNLRDLEINGQPTANALGDDLNPPANLDDEDGLVFNTPLIPAQVASVTITVNMLGAFQEGWIDFNADGDFADAGEQIITNVSPAALVQVYNFNVPANASLGATYARFRYTTTPNIPSFGPAPNGEVEDYYIEIGEFDFGDAPDPTYPTLLASDGARHKVDGTTFLGNLIDIEANGQPSAAGNGDDLNNLDDEDGVTFLWPLSAGNPCKIKVNASVGDALLNMWIDYNANGSWADAGEQIFTDLNLKVGDNFLTFIAPTNITAGLTYARFRFSHQPALSYTGYACDGEVEDYRLTISPYSEKWLQMVDASHPGLHTGENTTIADDWTCNGGQVTGIHWWGNYELNSSGQEKRGSLINHFLINIYSDVNCLPGSTLNTYTVPFSNARETYTGVNNSESGKIYRYEFVLPQAFAQVQGTSYWVAVQAFSNDPLNPAVWRWQEANRWYYPIKCGAATSYQPVGWQTIFWSTPAPGQYSDMAFEINNSKMLTINAYLEGLYNSSSGNMNEALGLTGAEWGIGIADRITVELHDGSDYNSIVFSDEEVYLSTTGQAAVSIPLALSDSYYITVKHRNSIETTTSAAVSFSGSSIVYSFDAPAKAYGNNMKQLMPGIYGFYSGDVYRDGVVDANDLIQVDNSAAAFSMGYIVTDVNGDGKADQSDVNLVKTNAHLFVKRRIP